MSATLLMGLMSLVVWLSNAYVVAMIWLGVRHLRARGSRLGDQAMLNYGTPHRGRTDEYFVYFLIPCLNEETVIGRTVVGLIGHDRSRVIVIDDGSDDETSQRALAGGDSQVTILRRELPEARKGKGEALNHGYAAVRRLVAEGGQDSEKVIVCVMDADGRLTDGAVAEVLGEFADPHIGAVQLAVRIRNRDTYLAAVQDFYFWAIAAVTQLGRVATRTVSLGGNGQFARLTALESLGERPWSACLTEDLDLTIGLILGGWKTTTAPFAAVSQQGVHRLSRFVRQRTRWYQGHMSCARYLPRIWRSPAITHTQAVELSLYLLVPWILDLPWSVLCQVALLGFATDTADYFVHSGGIGATLLSALAWYAFGFFPAVAAAVMQRSRAPETSWRRSLLMGHSFLVMNYVFFFCVWRALFALLFGRNHWDKTQREHEHPEEVPAHRYAPQGSPEPSGAAGLARG